MRGNAVLRQLFLQLNGILFRGKKSHEMIVANSPCNVIEVKPTGFILARAFKNGITRLAAFRIKDPPDSILLLQAENVRTAATDAKIMWAASFCEQAVL